MALFRVITPGIAVDEVRLNPGCNHVGREGEVTILIPHPSISRNHCELWLTEEAVLVRDLDSRNGTFVDGDRVVEARIGEGQILRIGDVELVLDQAPARISVPDVPLPARPKEQLFFDDGTPCCYRHDSVAAEFQCLGKCRHAFCGQCIRELRVAGGTPRRFCPECGGPCEPVAPSARAEKRASWLDKLKRAFTQPPRR